MPHLLDRSTHDPDLARWLEAVPPRDAVRPAVENVVNTNEPPSGRYGRMTCAASFDSPIAITAAVSTTVMSMRSSTCC